MDVANAFAYSFGTEGDFHKDMRFLKQELIDPDNIDYDYELHRPEPLCEEAGERVPNTAIGRHPISFLEIRNAEEAATWYREHHPEYPDYLCEVLAEYNFASWQRKPRSENGGMHAPALPGMIVRKTHQTIQF